MRTKNVKQAVSYNILCGGDMLSRVHHLPCKWWHGRYWPTWTCPHQAPAPQPRPLWHLWVSFYPLVVLYQFSFCCSICSGCGGWAVSQESDVVWSWWGVRRRQGRRYCFSLVYLFPKMVSLIREMSCSSSGSMKASPLPLILSIPLHLLTSTHIWAVCVCVSVC